MAIVEKHGLPYSISVHAANHHEVKLVQLNLPFRMVEEKPKNLIGDKAYDSDALDEDMREKGINILTSTVLIDKSLTVNSRHFWLGTTNVAL